DRAREVRALGRERDRLQEARRRAVDGARAVRCGREVLADPGVDRRAHRGLREGGRGSLGLPAPEESHPERVEEERTRELGRSVRAVAVALAPEPALLEKARGRRAEALGGAHGPTCGVVTRSASVVEQARLPV